MSEVSKLLEPNNLILRTHMESVSKDCDREKVRQDLIDSMEHYQGVGLSANQIGIMERVFIMYEDVTIRKILTCFNPKILETSKEQILMDEGCLSWPGLWLQVRRPDGIEATYEDENGELQEITLFGLECRIFQHEMDHMEGTNFTKKVSKMRLSRAKKRQQKRKKVFDKQKLA